MIFRDFCDASFNSCYDFRNFPAWSHDYEKGDHHSECRGAQGPPPNLSVLKQPFLPMGEPNSSPINNAIALRNFIWHYERKRNNVNYRFMLGRHMTTTAEKMVLFDDKSSMPPYVKRLKKQKLEDTLMLNNTWMDNLHSFRPFDSPMLDCVANHSTYGNGPTLCYTDASGCHLQPWSDDESLWSAKGSRTICDPNFARLSRLRGISVEEEALALNYGIGFSVVNFSSGQILVSYPSKVSSVQLNHVTDSCYSMDNTGNLIEIDYESNTVQSQWDKHFSEHMRPYEWSRILRSTHPSQIRLTFRKEVHLFDARTASATIVLYNASSDSIFTSAAPSVCNPYQCYLTTRDSLFLLDERFPRRQMCTWDLMFPGLPIEVATQTVDSVEYVAVRSTQDEVFLLANDWTHQTCPDDRGEIQFDCKMKDPYNNFYPVARGNKIRIPAKEGIMSSKALTSSCARNRTLLPWSGLTLVARDTSQLSLVAVNVVGDLFKAELIKDLSAPSCDDMFEEEELPTGTWGVHRETSVLQEKLIAHWAKKCEENSNYKKLVQFTSQYAAPIFPEETTEVKRMLPKCKKIFKSKMKSPAVRAKPKYIKKTLHTSKSGKTYYRRTYEKTKLKPFGPEFEPLSVVCPAASKLIIPIFQDERSTRVRKIFAGEKAFDELPDSESDSTYKSISTLSREQRRQSTESIANPDDIRLPKESMINRFMDELDTTSAPVPDDYEAIMATPLEASNFQVTPRATPRATPKATPKSKKKKKIVGF